MLFSVTDEDNIVQQANDVEFGLAASSAADPTRVFHVAGALGHGMATVEHGLISTAEAPFDGAGSSTLGCEGPRHGVDGSSELEHVCFGGNRGADRRTP